MEREAIPWDMLEAHPRRCGEHDCVATFAVTWWGSSPQVRGTFVHVGGYGVDSGAHPRRCGEHLPYPTADDPTPGSSPQVRGTCVRGER